MRTAFLTLVTVLTLSACSGDEREHEGALRSVLPSNFDHSRTANCRLRYDIRLENPPQDETVYERPKPATDLPQYAPGYIQVIAYPEEETVIDATYRGMKVCVVNATDAPVAVPTIDFWLYLIQEARDSEGNWRPIEGRDSPFCNFSNFSIELPAQRYWGFDVPRYEGVLKTELRFALALGQGRWIYSETFRGSINPSQFASNYPSELQPNNPDVGIVLDVPELK